MKNLLKLILPSPLANLARRVADAQRTSADYRADRRRYRRYASSGDAVWSGMSQRQIEAQLTKDYHRVEKGMALPSPKRPFGTDVQNRLDQLLASLPDDGSTPAYASAARDAQSALRAWNGGAPIDDGVAPLAQAPGAPNLSEPSAFFASRHSVRHFADRIPARDSIDNATRLAMASPSVCNRQPWIVRYYAGAEVPSILAHQNGNRGFRENVPAIAVISVDLALFGGAIERNQAWIEGGIFASSLMWAFHSLGLASCMLNLSMTTPSADALRRATGMQDQEVPIMMIAIGYAAEGHRRARSARRNPLEVVARPIPAELNDTNEEGIQKP